METTTVLLIAIPVLVVPRGRAAVQRVPHGAATPGRPSARCLARPAQRRHAAPWRRPTPAKRPSPAQGRGRRRARAPGGVERARHRRRRAARRRGCPRTPRPSASPAASSSTAASSGSSSWASPASGGRPGVPVAEAGRWLRLEDQRREHGLDRRQDQGRPGLRVLPRGPHVDHRVPECRPRQAPAASTSAELPGMEAGVTALYQKCVHLGCRVPECLTSQWFECPCHGSQYNRVGEKKGGPAPRGLDRFAISVSGSSSSSTPARSSRARRSAPTPPAKRPRAHTASVGVTDG